MSEIHPEVNQVIVPVAGVGNWGSGNHSTAALTFAPLRLLLGKHLHLPVLSPVVPSGFGIFGSPKKMAKDFSSEVDRELSQYPNAEVLFVAHSFGGLLCREYVLNSPEARDRYIGTVSLGSPHLGVEVGRWPGFKRTEKNINAYADDVHAGHEDDGHTTGFAMIATTLDEMVSPSSALPNIPGKNRHLFALGGGSHPELGPVHTHFSAGVEHGGLVFHPQSVWLVTQVARQLIKEQSSQPPAPSFEHVTF